LTTFKNSARTELNFWHTRCSIWIFSCKTTQSSITRYDFIWDTLYR